MKTIKKYYYKYKEIILYLLFGGLTTLVNFISYAILAHPLAMPPVAATAIAWLLSVLFAYVTNKIWVFESRRDGKKALLHELAAFFACRAFSGVLDIGIMWVFAELIRFNDLVVKIIYNMIVIVLNYLFSKLWIFKKEHKGES